MTGKHTWRAGAALRTLQTARFSCRKAQFRACSQEAEWATARYAHAHVGQGPGGLAGQRWLGAGS
jgi:hypothetical protein